MSAQKIPHMHDVNDRGLVLDHFIDFAMPEAKDVPDPYLEVSQGIKIGHALVDLTFWLSSGTVMGLYRDGRILPQDTDVDVSIRGQWNHPDLCQAGDGFLRLVQDLFPDLEPIRRQVFRDHVMQYAFRDRQNGNFILDFYFFYPHPKQAQSLIAYSWKHDLIKPAALCQVEWVTMPQVGRVPLPHDVPAYLAYRYGPTWKTPSRGDRGPLYEKGTPGPFHGSD